MIPATINATASRRKRRALSTVDVERSRIRDGVREVHEPELPRWDLVPRDPIVPEDEKADQQERGKKHVRGRIERP